MGKNEGEIKGSMVNMSDVIGLKGGTPHLIVPDDERRNRQHNTSNGMGGWF